MTKEDIEKIVGKSLDNNSFTTEKKIYNGVLYFYKREITQDHYFYVPAHSTLYLIKHNVDNYNPSITETANKPDSFKFNFEECLDSGRVSKVNAEIITSSEDNSIVKTNINTNTINRIDKIIIELTEIKAELLK